MNAHLEQNVNDNIALIICTGDYDKLGSLFFSAFPASS